MTLADLEALAPEWESLWQRDRRATPFQSPAWLIPWTRHLWGGGELIIQEDRIDGELTGLLPLFRWGTDQTTVSFLGAGVSDYGDILGSFRQISLPEDAILEEVPQTSPLLTSLFRSGGAEPCSACPILQLADYPTKLNLKLKLDLHRARNKISRRNAKFTQPTNPDAFFALHAKRWNAEPNPTLEAFQREAAQGFAERNLLRLHLLEIDSTPAAALFAIAAHGTLYCYLSAYDPQFTKLSPGAVLLAHAIDSAQSESLIAVDFLRGTEPYKYLWGAVDRPTYRVRPCRNTAESKEPPRS